MMFMNKKSLSTELVLYIFIFIVALVARFLKLGVAPLSEFEASWAVQSLDIARSNIVSIDPNPAYIFSTGVMFFLINSSNAIARVFPALAGAMLIWLPYFFRKPLGQTAALIMSFGLALDPGLVALSRLAGGPMIAMSFGLLAIGFMYARKPVWAGILSGFAILGGPAFIQGLLAIILVLLIAKLLEGLNILGQLSDFNNFDNSKSSIRTLVIAILSTIIVFGTLLLRYPQGLNALADTLPKYFNGWFTPSEIPASRLIAALIFYQPLALIFGMIGLIRAWLRRNTIAQVLSLWMVISLVLALFYPGKYVWDIAWVLIPLWALAGIEISRYLRMDEQERWPMLGEMAIILVLAVIMWLNLAGAARLSGDDQYARLRLVVILGAFVLGVITTILIAMGWSSKAAQRGLVMGMCIALGTYVLAGMWNVSQVNANGENELWYPSPYTKNLGYLIETLGDLSEQESGQRNTMVMVVESEALSLKWSLRDWYEVVYSIDRESVDVPPVILKSGEQSPPSQTIAYRGQGFGLWRFPAWNGALPADWLKWMVFRQAPQQVEELILWARGDIFPDGSMLIDTDSDSSIPLQDEPIIGDTHK
jgi:hypothetical protein